MKPPRIVAVQMLERAHQALIETLQPSVPVAHLGSTEWVGQEHIPFARSLNPIWPAITAWQARRTYRNICRQARVTPRNSANLMRSAFSLRRYTAGLAKSFSDYAHQFNILGVLSTSDIIGPNKAVVQQARKLNIPTFYIQHTYPTTSWDETQNDHIRQLYAPNSEHLCVLNEFEKQQMSKLTEGIRDCQIHVVGDCRSHTTPDITPSNPTHPVVLFTASAASHTSLSAMQSLVDIECRVFDAVLDALSSELSSGRSTPELIIKSHPYIDSQLPQPLSVDLVRRAQERDIKARWSTETIEQLAAQATLHISPKPTSSGYTAIQAGIPCLTYTPPHFRQLFAVPASEATPGAQIGVMTTVDDLDQLKQQIKSLINQSPPSRSQETNPDNSAAANLLKLIQDTHR